MPWRGARRRGPRPRSLLELHRASGGLGVETSGYLVPVVAGDSPVVSGDLVRTLESGVAAGICCSPSSRSALYGLLGGRSSLYDAEGRAMVYRVLGLVIALLWSAGLHGLQARGAHDLDGPDWPWWRGTERNGVSPAHGFDPAALTKALSGGPRIMWQADIGQGFSSPAVVGSRVYAMGNRGGRDTVCCLNAENGKTLWARSYPCDSGQYPGPLASPAVSDDRVYVLSRDSHLLSLDARTGNLIWEHRIAEEFGIRRPVHAFSSSPLLEEDALIVYASSALIAFDPESGAVLRLTRFDEPLKTSTGGYSTPVPFGLDGRKYLSMVGEDAVHVLDFETGRVVASAPWAQESKEYASVPDAVVSHGRIYVTGGYGLGTALFVFDGTALRERWHNDDFGVGSQVSSPVLIDGALYGFDGNAGGSARFGCVDFGTGEQLWTTPMRYGSCAAIGDTLIVLSEQGGLLSVEASRDGYRKTSETRLPPGQYWTPPVPNGPRVFIRNTKGDLFCIRAQ